VTGGFDAGAGCGRDWVCAESGNDASDINSSVLTEIFFTSDSSQEAALSLPPEAS
jgi:hypothetical protein